MDSRTTGPRSPHTLVWRIAGVAEGTALGLLVVAGTLLLVATVRSRSEPEAAQPSETPVIHVGRYSELPPPTNFYIVDSEAAAGELRFNLELGNNVRNSVGLSPVRDEVVVVADAAEARFVAECLEEGNRILAAFNTGDQVINLVG